MSEDAYATALKNTLTEIQNICPDVSCSFFFSRDGKTVAENPEAIEETTKKTVDSFQSLTEKADSIGDLETLLIKGEKGKVQFTRVNDIYLALATSEDTDMTHVQSFVRVMIPTILKLLEGIAPTPLNFISSKELIVNTLSGFLVGDSVQIDVETIESWFEHLDKKGVNRVHVESSGGKTVKCKFRELNDQKLKGKGIIKIPEKVCKKLGVKEGELVTVKPIES
jgi:predicted regulator of Ras-like GTPase activity (Roadblock/LC7/MglB family)